MWIRTSACYVEAEWYFKGAEAGIRAEELLARRRQEFKTERWLWQAA